MASGIVRSFISEFCDEANESPRMESGRKFVEVSLHHITNGDASMDAFDEFSEELVMSLKEIFKNLREYKSTSTKKEKLWCEFHHKRLHTLPDIWKCFCRSLDIPYSQLVARLRFHATHMHPSCQLVYTTHSTELAPSIYVTQFKAQYISDQLIMCKLIAIIVQQIIVNINFATLHKITKRKGRKANKQI